MYKNSKKQINEFKNSMSAYWAYSHGENVGFTTNLNLFMSVGVALDKRD